jgi:hypothetical protein
MPCCLPHISTSPHARAVTRFVTRPAMQMIIVLGMGIVYEKIVHGYSVRCR